MITLLFLIKPAYAIYRVMDIPEFNSADYNGYVAKYLKVVNSALYKGYNVYWVEEGIYIKGGTYINKNSIIIEDNGTYVWKLASLYNIKVRTITTLPKRVSKLVPLNILLITDDVYSKPMVKMLKNMGFKYTNITYTTYASLVDLQGYNVIIEASDTPLPFSEIEKRRIYEFAENNAIIAIEDSVANYVTSAPTGMNNYRINLVDASFHVGGYDYIDGSNLPYLSKKIKIKYGGGQNIRHIEKLDGTVIARYYESKWIAIGANKKKNVILICFGDPDKESAIPYSVLYYSLFISTQKSTKVPSHYYNYFYTLFTILLLLICIKLNFHKKLHSHLLSFALKRGSFYVIVFTSPTCPYCKDAIRLVDSVADELNLNVNYVDITKNRDAAERYSLRSVPTIVVEKDKKEILRFVDVPTREDFIKRLKGSVLRRVV